jgi:chemotaxis protein methyltransferase CheR
MPQPRSELTPSLVSAATLVERRLGLCFPPHRLNDLARGLEKASRALRRGPLESFVPWLLSGGASERDLETIASFLTIGETYLFRDRRCFDALEHHILPELMERATWRRLRIWSAGCSSGEELYSIAMLLDQLLPDPRGWSLTLLGTDLNVASLRRASQGIYTPWSFRERSAESLARWVQPAGPRRFRVEERIRQLTSFSYLNLAEDCYPSLHNNTAGMDLVLCRNVLMYFDQERALAVVHKLARSLADGGWLILGPSELHLGHAAGLKSQSFGGSSCFRAQPGAPGFFAVPALPATTPPPFPAAPPAPAPAPVPRARSRTPAPPAKPSPPAPSDSLERARALHERGEDREASSLLKARLGEHDRPHPDADPSTMLLLARCLANLGRLHEAGEWCARAVERDKMNAAAHLLLGTVLQEKGELDLAAASLRRAHYLEPDDPLVQFALAGLARQQGDLAAERRALVALQRMLHAIDQDAEVPGFDGLTAARLAQVVAASLAQHGGES